MARYIEETEVYKLVEPTGIARVHCSQIDDLPRADVVPKIESEFDSIPVEVAQVLKDKAVEKAKAEVAREIFEEIEKLKHTKWDWTDCIEWNAIADLKKKYTEGDMKC